MTTQFSLWDQEPPELPRLGSLQWLGVEGAILEAGSCGLIVDARAARLCRLADERGVEEAFRL